MSAMLTGMATAEGMRYSAAHSVSTPKMSALVRNFARTRRLAAGSANGRAASAPSVPP
jgi:hypothetical protein